MVSLQFSSIDNMQESITRSRGMVKRPEPETRIQRPEFRKDNSRN